MAKVEGQSDKTLELYEYVFKRLTGFISEKKLVTQVQVKDVRKYLATLMDDGLKKTTVAIHYRHLKSFFNWLVEENYLREAPTEKIDEPKTPNKFPRVLDSEQVKKLLKAAKNRKGEWSSYRNYCMLVVFVEMGLRLNELVNAKIKDLDLKNRSLKVHGKGAKDRKVYFGKRTLRTLRHWMKIRDYNQEGVGAETIFISQGGDKLKVRNVEQLVTRIQKKADFEDTKVSPHVLRHTAATFAVENGLTAFQLKSQFGWEQIGTALRYVHMSDKSLQESYQNSSPMDNLTA
ncbi:MAG: tyrosine-type recombinase/integrase [Candidatus Bipolaricaulota bacterium]|nr:tyrosine-type recombinase/integrase [Candidatus Bipolaricaulota bacterium]